MACLTNYTVQCKDITTGETGCFLFDIPHWKSTGQFKAISPVYKDLVEFYKNVPSESRESTYIERK